MSSETRHAQSTQNNFAYLCNISIKAWGIKLIFCQQINIKVFYKMIVSLWVYIERHARSTQNSRFKISLQYVKGNVKNEVDFLPADRRRRFLQSDTIILGVCVARNAHIIQNNKFAISLQHIKKQLSDAVDFLHADKHESLLQIDSITLMQMVKYSQSSQNSMFAVSLQYLKKEVRD